MKATLFIEKKHDLLILIPLFKRLNMSFEMLEDGDMTDEEYKAIRSFAEIESFDEFIEACNGFKDKN